MMTAETALVKPATFAEIFAPAVANTPADVDFSDLADEPTAAEYDAMADEAAAYAAYESGLPTW